MVQLEQMESMVLTVRKVLLVLMELMARKVLQVTMEPKVCLVLTAPKV